jgi:hypothetical protein
MRMNLLASTVGKYIVVTMWVGEEGLAPFVSSEKMYALNLRREKVYQSGI